MNAATLARRAEALRAFNRFYTRRIGVVGERVLESPFSLAETRVLWELAHAPAGSIGSPAVGGSRTSNGAGSTAGARAASLSASDLARLLGLDPGYLSRLLAGLRKRGLVLANADPADARRQRLRLSAAGRRAFAPLEKRSQQQMTALLAPLSDDAQRELLAAAERVGALLADGAQAARRNGHGDPGDPGVGARAERAERADCADGAAATRPASASSSAPASLRLRPPVPGDLGWVVSRHAALYAADYGWDWRFEAMVARIAADFIDRFDPKREACWVAERTGEAGTGTPAAAGAERLGCVFLVQARDEKTGRVEPGVAQLRMLLVEPTARGLGLGKRLVAECERFARQRGYRRIRLWTNSVLLAARSIYQNSGYRLIAKERHTSFGKRLVGETWELAL